METNLEYKPTIAGLSRNETERILRLRGIDAPQTQEADAIAEQINRVDESLTAKLAEKVANLFAEALPDSLALAAAQGNPDCEDCDTAMELGLYRKACPICHSRPYCSKHARLHISTFHHESPAYHRQMLDITEAFMAQGWMTGYYTRETAHTLTRHNNVTGTREGRNTGKSPWYDWAQHLDLARACITTWRQGKDAKESKEISAQIDEFKEITGLRAYWWAPGSGMTMFMAQRTDLKFLPEDPTAPTDEQTSASGFKFNYGNTPAKCGKRCKFGTHAEGCLFAPTPSRLPYINLPDGTCLKVKVRDTRWIGNHEMARGAGDGNGSIRRSAAYRLMRASGIKRKLSQVIGIQPNIMGADFFIKGILLVRPDSEFAPGDDIIVDKDSISRQLLNDTCTLGKLIPKRHKGNKRYVYIEPVMQVETVDAILDQQEMDTVQLTLAKSIDTETYAKAREAQVRPEPENQADPEHQEDQEDDGEPEWTPSYDTEMFHRRTALSTEFATGMTEIFAQHGGLWTDPLAVKRLAGGPHAHWTARANKSRPMAGRFLSGEKVYLMHYFFAGTTAPKPSFARLVFHDEQTDELIGIALNKRDTERFESPLDSSDCDDQLTLIFMTGPDGKPKVLVLKLPMSIDGGVILDITVEDARKLKRLGYHFYQQSGTHRFPNLHDVDKNGSPLYPDVLQPREIPEAQKPTWTTREDEAAASLQYMNRFAPVTGKVTNLSTALYYSRLWDPATCKCNYSEGVIDRVANGDADPTAIADALTAILYNHVANGLPVDSCVVGRVKKMLIEHHINANGEDAPRLVINETCIHSGRKEALADHTDWMATQLRRRSLAANGPVEWLSATFDPQVVSIMLDAKRERDAAWTERYHADRELSRKEPVESVDEYGDETTEYRYVYPPQEREALQALNVERARLRERSAIEQAIERLESMEGYEAGSAAAIWKILSLQGKTGAKSRFDIKNHKPVSTYALAALPDHEHMAFARKGTPVPTIPLRPTQGQEELEPDRNLILTSLTNGQWWLVDEESHDKVLRVKADAGTHTHGSLRVRTICYLPQLEEEPEVTSGESILMVQLTPRTSR